MERTPHKVAQKKDVPSGEGKIVTAGGKEFALFNVEGQFYALDNACPHRGGPMGQGPLEGSIVSCPWHGWQFDVRTGALVMNPETKLGCYPVQLHGEDLFLEI